MTFDELHVLVTSAYTDAIAKKLNKAEIEKVMEDCFFEFLIDGYMEGFYDLPFNFGFENGNAMSLSFESDYDRALNVVTLRYGEDNRNFIERVDEHVRNSDLPRLIALADSEYHRVRETGSYDCAKLTQEHFDREHTTNGTQRRQVYKVWNDMDDDRVRLTHRYLHHIRVPLDDYFYTIDGDYGRFPGDFKSAENNAGCRCHLTYTVG